MLFPLLVLAFILFVTYVFAQAYGKPSFKGLRRVDWKGTMKNSIGVSLISPDVPGTGSFSTTSPPSVLRFEGENIKDGGVIGTFRFNDGGYGWFSAAQGIQSMSKDAYDAAVKKNNGRPAFLLEPYGKDAYLVAAYDFGNFGPYPGLIGHNKESNTFSYTPADLQPTAASFLFDPVE